ncbi:DUF3427 domain-containing protein [Bacillus mangrovi]|uniref:DUF3427 domain-containing protein n=1 Tax=Metabacillus mangrovi TaxID=1491830 RepID=A0A7X2V5J1_9BACI|nr:DUF3427 domain-containing protein [Metabacillus mangrovi]MTH54241.1 DUF3427 domain-containing protein [Metabacillus mangrovi]
MSNLVEKLKNSLHKGFIDKQTVSGHFRPELLVNNTRKNENVLNAVLEELEKSIDFIFSVAFITESGLATLKSHLLDLKQKGIRGRILTSTFLNFNQPKVFKELLKLENVDVRTTDIKGFHSKGYIFKHDTHYSLIVGSSNLTAHALKVNYEWNVKLTSHEDGEIIHHFKNQFEEVWENAHQLTSEWIENYEKSYIPPARPNEINQLVEMPASYETNALKEALKIVPNKMQEAALSQIAAVRENGKDKGIIISATGTGKTYLSAFDVRRYAPKRMLFIVHREQILSKAKSDFLKILGGIESDFGIYSGNNKQTQAKYLFATIQTISKEANLNQFDPREFDYILIDEVHKAGAASYRRVIEYFQPKFMMGMTATPERTDHFNVYQLFDYNIAYEIRLQEALEEDMLCPFHYFGVTDMVYDGQLLDEEVSFSKLVDTERVDHIVEKLNYYGHSGDTVKGLIFCSRKDEAAKLSIELNNRGLRTVSLTGDDSQDVRILAVNQLENEALDYILTVDIFNEGIDIPCVNQVVMLRQTQSSIVFIQQLGRGLRKHLSKEYVTIIDFIGNYKNNYLIPVALSGDKSQNKDNIRRHVKDTSYIKGVSTINFEEIAKKQIFKAITNSKLTSFKVLKEAYKELENRIGRVPELYDFIQHNSIDPVVIVEEHFNYYQFLQKMKVDVPVITDYESKVLTMLSLEILNGQRLHEIVLLDLLMMQDKVSVPLFTERLLDLNCQMSAETLTSVRRVFDLSFFTQVSRKKYGELPIIELEGTDFAFSQLVKDRLSTNSYFRRMVEDLIKSAKVKAKSFQCNQLLTINQKYSRKDVCKLLNWKNDESSTVYGYKTKHQTCPIFITYHKKSEVEESINYGDEFLSQDLLKWFTRSNRTLESKEVKEIIQADEANIDLHIFVKKEDGEGSDFYYLGKAHPDKENINQSKMIANGKELPVVHVHMVMEQPIDYKIYQYLVNGEEQVSE